ANVALSTFAARRLIALASLIANGTTWWLGDVPRSVLRPELLQRLPKKPDAFLRIQFDPGVIFYASQSIQKRGVILFGGAVEVRLFRHRGLPSVPSIGPAVGEWRSR
ncbi:hypothetical protein, partial [Sphingomonas sp. CROZ-RG-20F-R02-07]|uniref:hypothetical protein n=1 Tax=Sphingomonas sp. CROZ-RG-20F-R02-07 TaxID=2914832 RepID=UPI001F59B770